MATNLAIDSSLIESARIISGHRTKKSAVTEALMEYIRRRKQLKVTDLFSHVEYEMEKPS